jgi:hypothetical protein
VIGSIGFTFSGDLKVAEHICNEFKQNVNEADFEINIDIQPKKNLSIFSGDFTKNEKGRFFNTGYAAHYPGGNSMKVSVDRAILRRGLLQGMAKVRDWNYLTPSEIVAKNLIYDLLEPISHDHMVKKGMGFIHASAYAKASLCALVTGEGGMGKTALCLIAQEKGYGYMNDDLSLIDKKGLCYHHPKRLQIYGYNIKESPDLKRRIFKDRGSVDRIQFNFRNMFYGPKKVRRRVPSNELFKKVSKRARITKIFFLARGKKLSIQMMDANDFVDTELEIIRNEFSDYIEGINHSRHHALMENTRKLYSSLSEKADCLKIISPFPYDLDKLFETIQKKHPLSSE